MTNNRLTTMKLPAIPKLVNDSLQNDLEIELSSRPGVYDVIKALALKAKRAGHTKYSIKALVEVARWEYTVQMGDKTSRWLWDNSLTSRLGRKLMDEVPELAGFFKLRALTSIPAKPTKKAA